MYLIKVKYLITACGSGMSVFTKFEPHEDVGGDESSGLQVPLGPHVGLEGLGHWVSALIPAGDGSCVRPPRAVCACAHLLQLKSIIAWINFTSSFLYSTVNLKIQMVTKRFNTIKPTLLDPLSCMYLCRLHFPSLSNSNDDYIDILLLL